MSNPELNPRARRKPTSQVPPATGQGHKPQSSADHRRSIPIAGAANTLGATPAELAARRLERMRSNR